MPYVPALARQLNDETGPVVLLYQYHMENTLDFAESCAIFEQLNSARLNCLIRRAKLTLFLLTYLFISYYYSYTKTERIEQSTHKT